MNKQTLFMIKWYISDVLVVQGSISIDEKTDIIPPLILGAIFVFFFIILLISLFCFCRRKKRKPPGKLCPLVDYLLFLLFLFVV